LTTNDPEKQKQEQSGGVTIDNSAAEMHTTIFSISESPKDRNIIWVGTDDGNVQLTRDAGKSWKNVVGNVSGLPANSWVNWIQASNFDAGTAFAAFDRHTFGDFEPYVYKTTDYGQTWTPLATPKDLKGINGYAYVIKEDLAKPNLLFLGTEFGLYVSVDGGNSWAQFKGSHFPAVAVRDLAIQPRTNDLALATHGRGIWIIDDITPLRSLTPDLLAKEASFVAGEPVQQQRVESNGGWPNGAATFTGDNPPDAAVITYYQKSRHLFGKLKIEVLDPSGQVIDSLPASKRPGLNRVIWSMHEKPPRVPPGAQLAFAGTTGPRVMPGTYTVRMTKNDKPYEMKLTVGLDQRNKFSEADRKAQYDAAHRVKDLFSDESALMDRIIALRGSLAQDKKQLAADKDLQKAIADFDGKLDAVRKQIVATTEGGAITGEERLREHTDQLFAAILSYEGKPADYQVARIEALRRELTDVTGDFEKLLSNDLPKLNESLRAKGQPELEPPPAKVALNDEEEEGGGAFHGTFDPDLPATPVKLPANFRLLH